MQEFKSLIIQEWPKIVEYALMIFAYFLLFLFRSKVNCAKRDLGVIFKEKTAEVTAKECESQAYFESMKKEMQKEFEESKARYNAAINEIADLKDRLNRAENALVEMIMEVDDGEQTAYEED